MKLRDSPISIFAFSLLVASLGVLGCCQEDQGPPSVRRADIPAPPAPDLPSKDPAPSPEPPAPSVPEPPKEAPPWPVEQDQAPAAPPLQETPEERRKRIVLAEIQEGFEVNVLGLSLVEGVSRKKGDKQRKGVQIRLSGFVKNSTGKTITGGFLSGAIVLRFGDDTVKVRMSPDGLRPSVSPERPWRTGTARPFRLDTYVFPKIMMEYTPVASEARIYATFRDPVDFTYEAPVWKQDIDWLAARGAAVLGEARVTGSENLKVGPRGRQYGRTQVSETVELLYQKNDHFLIKAEDGVGWVSQKGLIIKDLGSIYGKTASHSSETTARSETVSLTVEEVDTVEDAPNGAKLRDGERFVLVDVSLSNKGEKDINCNAFFLDFGPREQLPPHPATSKFNKAFTCEKNKLPPGQTIQGRLAFLRQRHQVPFALGFTPPNERPLLLDIYKKAYTKPYTK